MTIRATIYDAEQMPAGREDTLFVDTNVWVDLVHPRAQPKTGTPRYQQFEVYSDCIKAIQNGSGRLTYGALSLNELGHVVERVEQRIWSKGKGAQGTVKAFRHDAVERAKTIRLIRTAFRQVDALADEVSMTVDFAHSIQVVDRAVQEKHGLDVYDMYLVEAAKAAHAVLTHDPDFATVPDLVVVTANPDVLSAATASGDLAPWPAPGQSL